jgi:hypothetical protein
VDLSDLGYEPVADSCELMDSNNTLGVSGTREELFTSNEIIVENIKNIF